MAMLVRSREHTRVEQRWLDYSSILTNGTDPAVGSQVPAPPDRSGEFLKAFAIEEPDLGAAETILNKAWADDEGSWQRRLGQGFLSRLKTSSRDFSRLVKAGCQPDRLALRFHEATSPREAAEVEQTLRRHAVELASLLRSALAAIHAFAERQDKFDEWTFRRRRLRVIGEDIDNLELKNLRADFDWFGERRLAELDRLARIFDGRRQPLWGHAQVRLSLSVHAITGSYRDSVVEKILNDLYESRGAATRCNGALKRRRARWSNQFGKQRQS